MDAELTVGLVGCGRIAGLRHLPVIAGLPDVSVVAAADPDERRRTELADRFGIARRYASADELLDGEHVDAVVVCVPAERHAAVAVAALERGKHVLVEKPLSLSMDDAERIREAERGSAGRLLLALNVRRHPFVRRLRELLAAGVVGEPVALATAWSSSFDYRPVATAWRKGRASGGGVICELAPHHVDVWRFVLGSEIEEISAVSISGPEPWEDETLALSGRSESGVALSGSITQRSVNANEIVLYGTEARVRADLYRADGFELRRAEVMPGDALPRLRAAAGSVRTLAGTAVRREPPAYEQTYHAEWLHFVDVVRGTAEPDCTVEDGVRNLQAVLAAAAAASEGRTVRVADAPRTLAPVAGTAS